MSHIYRKNDLSELPESSLFALKIKYDKPPFTHAGSGSIGPRQTTKIYRDDGGTERYAGCLDAGHGLQQRSNHSTHPKSRAKHAVCWRE